MDDRFAKFAEITVRHGDGPLTLLGHLEHPIGLW
ncbi:hypothetical protein MGSAQ_000864, partial [marine sediment metagenome]